MSSNADIGCSTVHSCTRKIRAFVASSSFHQGRWQESRHNGGTSRRTSDLQHLGTLARVLLRLIQTHVRASLPQQCWTFYRAVSPTQHRPPAVELPCLAKSCLSRPTSHPCSAPTFPVDASRLVRPNLPTLWLVTLVLSCRAPAGPSPCSCRAHSPDATGASPVAATPPPKHRQCRGPSPARRDPGTTVGLLDTPVARKARPRPHRPDFTPPVSEKGCARQTPYPNMVR